MTFDERRRESRSAMLRANERHADDDDDEMQCGDRAMQLFFAARPPTRMPLEVAATARAT